MRHRWDSMNDRRRSTAIHWNRTNWFRSLVSSNTINVVWKTNGMCHWISSFHRHICKHEQHVNRHSRIETIWILQAIRSSALSLPCRRINARERFHGKMYKQTGRCSRFEQNMDLINTTRHIHGYVQSKVLRMTYFSTNWNRAVAFAIVCLRWNFSGWVDRWRPRVVRYSSLNIVHLCRGRRQSSTQIASFGIETNPYRWDRR